MGRDARERPVLDAARRWTLVLDVSVVRYVWCDVRWSIYPRYQQQQQSIKYHVTLGNSLLAGMASHTAFPLGKSMLGNQANSKLPSSPAYGFGTEERSKVGGSKQYFSKDHCADKFGANSPGPVYYPPTTAFERDAASAAPPSHSFGASHRYMLSAQKHVTSGIPGPGMYHLAGAVGSQQDSQKHSYSSWGFGTSTRADQARVFVSPAHAKTVTEFIDSPGPAAYQHNGSIGSQSDSRKGSSASYGMGTSDRFFYDKKGLRPSSNPGPGAYTLHAAHGKQVSSIKPSYPINSFTKADRDRSAKAVYLGPKQQASFWGRGSPGPAVYSMPNSVGNQVSSTRRTAPRAGFGTADRFSYMDNALKAMATPGPGSYGV